jgi:hypothetical protein
MNESPRNGRSLHRQRRWMTALLLVFTVSALVGCDKVQEMVNGDPDPVEPTGGPIEPGTSDPAPNDPVNPPVDDPAEPVKPEPVKPVEPEPPKIDPQEVIDRLLNTDPKAMNNGLLAEAAALGSGLEQITELNLNRSNVNDAGLVHLAKFPELTTVDLTLCKITANGLTPLVSHPKIHTLNLAETLVHDAGIAQVIGMSQLKDLDLTGCRVTDAGVAQLAALVNLDRLILNNNQSVSGATFKNITDSCKALRVLGVNNTSFAPQGFPLLKDSSIEELQASHCQANNVNIYELRHCRSLSRLFISYNPDVNDTGVFKLLPALAKQLTDLSLAGTGGGSGLDVKAFNALARCKKLKTLDLSNTSPPKDYVKKLREMLTETEINWDGK